MLKFPYFKQQDRMDCGPTCLRMVAKHYGRNYSIQKLRALGYTNKRGASLLGLSNAAEKIGFRTLGAKLTIEQLKEIELPCVLHWRQNHFVVLYKIKKGIFYVADPAKDLIKYTEQEFKRNWYGHKEMYDGITLILSPTPGFYEQEGEKKN